MRHLLRWLRSAPLLSLLATGCGGADKGHVPDGGNANVDAALPTTPPWLVDSRILVPGVGVTNQDCRGGFCQHNENTDLYAFGGSIYFIHRTAESQILGPNSSLHIYKTTTGEGGGKTYQHLAKLLAPEPGTPIGGDKGRDLRDPHFYSVGQTLYIKALARLPVTSARDSDVDTVALESHSTDGGNTWSELAEMGPHGYSFWRVREHGGVYYSAAYQDGDQRVVMFTSKDGVHWTQGPVVWDVSADTPLETELSFMPSGRMLALVRTDGLDSELFGNTGRVRTRVCWANPPAYDAFSCPQFLDGQRLDGPLSFFWQGRLFEIARKHLPGSEMKKRTSLFEIGGTLEGGPLTITELGELPSAGDTSYAGAAALDDHRFAITWYSGDLVDDEPWVFGMLHATDIRAATLDLSKL